MNRVLKPLVPLLLLAHPLSAQSDAGVLQDLQGVNPLVDVQLPIGAPHDERTLESRLHWVLDLRLRMAEVPVSEPSVQNTLCIYINALYDNDLYVLSYAIELREPAYLLRNVREDRTGDHYWVISWRSAGVARVGPEHFRIGLEEVVEGLADEFIGAWRAVNPSD